VSVLAPWERAWLKEMADTFDGEWDRQWIRWYCRQSHTSINSGRATIVRLGLPHARRIQTQMTPARRKVFQKAMMRAAQIVCRAIKSGALKSLKDNSVLCVDCGLKPASQYEHRDYAKPLDVEPVCQRCNLKRGPARLSAPVPVRRYARRKSAA
jgi:hypothetical protein